MVDVGDDKL